MPILTKEVEVKPTGKMIQYYKDLGYNARYNQPIIVKVKDLPKCSFVRVDVLCDYCKEEIFSVTYCHYNEELKHINKHACKNCWQKKAEEVVMIKYGVKHASQLKEVQKKRERTLEKHYGVSVPLKSKEIKDRLMQTVFNTYGVNNISQLEKIKERKAQTTLEHFGVRNPSKNENIRIKMRNSCMDKYGVDNPAKSPEIREKMSKTFYTNSSQKASKQQRYINELYQGILNFPIKYYNADIYLPDDNIIIEYDGGGHFLNLVTGRESIEEFDQKEIVRNNIIKREGYKIVRIISPKDLLPSDSTLLQMLQGAKQYFSLHPQHSWIEFNIDTSSLRNAENKQGVSYNYGALRKIKDSDLSPINDLPIEENA